jgi:hypothetical protein
MKKQTAVEWIYENLKVCIPKSQFNDVLLQDLFNQALAMEKEQHCTTYINAMKECMINPLGDELYLEDAKQYYNETYGGDK